MNRSSTFPVLEDKIRAATKEQIPLPREEFVARLGQHLRAQKPPRQPGPARFSIQSLQPARIMALSFFLLILLVTLIIGPQNVLAALQNLLGYVPGVGFVESGMVLVEPVTVEREGIRVTVENLVATEEETTLVYRAVDRPVGELAAYREAHQDENLARDELNIFLRTGDGTVYSGRLSKIQVEKDGRRDKRGNELVVYFIFPPLPAGTNEVTLLLDRLPEMYPGMAPENWEIPLQLEAAGETNQIPAFQPEYATLTPEAAALPETTAAPALRDGVQLSLNAVSVYENTITLSISVEWEKVNWDHADVRGVEGGYRIVPIGEPQPHFLSLTDANGTEVPLVIDLLESPGSEPGRKATFIFSGDIVTRELVSPLTLTLSNVNFFAIPLPEEQTEWSYEFTPAADFQPGDCERISQRITIYDYPVEFSEVCSLESPAEIPRRGGGGGGVGSGTPTPRPPVQYALELHLISDDASLSVGVSSKETGRECPTNCAGAGNSGSLAEEEHEWTNAYIQLYFETPNWPVTYTVTQLSFRLPGPWSIQFDLPPIQEGTGGTSPSAGGFEAGHLAGETIPDGATLKPGEAFIKTFTLKNVGETTWDEQYHLILFNTIPAGEPMGSALSIPLGQKVLPGEEVVISIPLTASQNPGMHSVVWQLVNGQGEVVKVDGGNIWLFINVEAGTN